MAQCFIHRELVEFAAFTWSGLAPRMKVTAMLPFGLSYWCWHDGQPLTNIKAV